MLHNAHPPAMQALVCFFCLRDEWLQCHSNDSSFGLRLRMAHCYQEANTYTWLHLPFGMFAPESPRRRILYRHPALKCATVHNLQIKRELHIGNINRAIAFDTLFKINQCRAMPRVAILWGCSSRNTRPAQKKEKWAGIKYVR